MAHASAGTWTAALCTLAVFSYLYRDNALWRATEHLYVGLAAGYGLGYGWHNFLGPLILDDIVAHHQWGYAIPLAFGLLVFGQLLRGGQGLARFPLAIWVGYGAGYALTYLPRTLWLQVTGSMVRPDSLAAIVLLLCLLAALVYFLFTIGTRGLSGRVARLGRLAVMVALGASFGGAVLYRYTIFLGRMAFVLRTWLGL